MRIGIVCYPSYGGSGIVATLLGKALAKNGHTIHFISSAPPVKLDRFAENIFFHEVGVSAYPLFENSMYELNLTNKIVDVCKHERLDLLHVHYAIPHATAAYLAQRILEGLGFNLPFITTLHGTDISLVGKNELYKDSISFAINQSNGVTSVSASLKDETLDYFDITQTIDVIPNFIEIKEFDRFEYENEVRQKFAPEGEKLLCHISNFRPVKRVGDVIDIFHQVQKKVSSKLLLVGDGPDRQILEKKCREYGICDKVFFLGKLKKVEKILVASDLFLLPSEKESFGLAALEAMAAKTPVISSNVGGIPEINTHGRTGFTHPLGDVDSMAQSALELLLNKNKLNLFKDQSYHQAKTFELRHILPLYEALYKRLLSS